MDSSLQQLMGKMPPPTDPRHRMSIWSRLESAVGITYPTSFKEFVEVYGGSVWFDNVCPFFSEATTDDEVKEIFFPQPRRTSSP